MKQEIWGAKHFSASVNHLWNHYFDYYWHDSSVSGKFWISFCLHAFLPRRTLHEKSKDSAPAKFWFYILYLWFDIISDFLGMMCYNSWTSWELILRETGLKNEFSITFKSIFLWRCGTTAWPQFSSSWCDGHCAAINGRNFVLSIYLILYTDGQGRASLHWTCWKNLVYDNVCKNA